MSNYDSQIRIITTKHPLDLQKRKLAALLNTAMRERSRLGHSSFVESQNLSREIIKIRRAMSDVSKKLERQW